MDLSNCRLVLVLSFFGGIAGPAIAQSKTSSTVPLLHSRTHLLIVSARVNDRGPYKFILDTGSNITLLESSLFRELGLKEIGHTSTKVVDWMALGKIASAEEISIEGGPSRSNVRVLEVDGIKRPDIDSLVRGVLGENFLSGFDVLIDNRRHRITFDNGNLLASSLQGEHLALALSSDVRGAKVDDRPLVSARAPFDANRPLLLLLDTGSESTYLVTRQGASPDVAAAATPARGMALLGGNSPCVHWKDRLQLGRTTTPRIRMTSCLKSPAAVADNDGTLPTFIFDRIFISHAGGYFILDPVETGALGQDSRH